MLASYYERNGKDIDYSHNIEKNPRAMDFHLHDQFEIYFFLRGRVNYFIEKHVYPLKSGDLLVMNSHEIHRASFLTDDTYERMVIHFNPAVARFFSPPGCDLLACFLNRPKGEQNRFELNRKQAEEVFKRLKGIEYDAEADAAEAGILKLVHFIDLLVYINRLFRNSIQAVAKSDLPGVLQSVLDHIENHLSEDLSLERLAEAFFIDKYYLSRLFKSNIGSTLHQYIIYKRVSEAKRLLSQGFSVTDTCAMCGFDNYNNFIKRFGKTVGTSPGKYRTQSNRF